MNQLGRELGRRGHELAIVTSHGDETDAGLADVDGLPVLRVDAHRVVEARDAAGILRVQIEITRFARSFEADVVHSHDAGPDLWMYHRSTRGRATARGHAAQRHDPQTRRVTAGTRPHAAGCDVDDGGVARRARRRAQLCTLHPGCSSVIENGIEPPPDSTVLRDRPPGCCASGVSSGRRASTSPSEPSWRCTGPPRHASRGRRRRVERRPLMTLAAELGVAHAVDFLGAVDRAGVAPGFSSTRAAVLIPSVLRRIAARGARSRVGRATRRGDRHAGLAEAVVDGETALVVPVDDTPALAAAALDLLANPLRARALGRAARVRAEHRVLATVLRRRLRARLPAGGNGRRC